MRGGALFALFGAGAIALALATCGGESKPARTGTPPPPPPPPPVSSAEVGAPPPGAPESVTFSQIMIVYALPKGTPGVTRTREQAWDLARDLVRRIQSGESFDALLEKHTEDRGEDGKPFNSGSYSKSWKDLGFNPLIKRIVFGLPVGGVAPIPVDSGYAFHILRRDA